MEKEIVIAKRTSNSKNDDMLSENAIIYRDGKVVINLDKTYQYDAEEIVKVKIKFDKNTPKDFGTVFIKTKHKKHKLKNINNLIKVYSILVSINNNPPREIDELLFLPDVTMYCCENIVRDGITLSFSIDFSEDFDACAKIVKYIINNAKDIYEKIIKETTEEMLDLANKWNNKLTAPMMKEIIDKKQLYFEVFHNEYYATYDTCNLFTDHTFQYVGSIDSDEHSIDIF